jgi:myo-inositol catabolism protein IolC
MYLLQLDQRAPWHLAAITAAKQVVYDGLLSAIDAGFPIGNAGIVADERSAGAILREAKSRGLTTVCAIGTSPDHVDDRHAVATDSPPCDATYWRVVLRYNPDGDALLNAVDVLRVKRLAAMLGPGPPSLMCELVVPPTGRQIRLGVRAYCRDMLPSLTERAVSELLDAGIEPQAWTIESCERRDDYLPIVAAIARGGRNAACWLRAAGHADMTTRALMATGLRAPGIVGAILARASFWEPAVAWMSGRLRRPAAVAAVAAVFQEWVNVLGSDSEWNDVIFDGVSNQFGGRMHV